MTLTLKTFRKDIRHFMSHLADAESFRTTGDCSVHYHDSSRHF